MPGVRARHRPRRARRSPGSRRRSRPSDVPRARAPHAQRGRRDIRGCHRAMVGAAAGEGCARRLARWTRLGPEPLARARVPDQRLPRPRRRRGTPSSLVRVDGHASWCNSAALHAAGITRDTPDPTGGIVVKDAHGEPTGLLIDTAQRLVQRAEPLPSEERFDQAVRDAIAECLATGLTGIHEMGATLFALASYRRLDRARAVSVPELRGRGRTVRGDLGLLPRARARGDR